ncbi:MAG: histone deacetylase family protein [Candidatus Heimdallarchaeaceae archaeon]
MKDLVVVYSDIFKQHVMDKAHPESPKRLDKIISGIRNVQSQLSEVIDIVSPEEINDEDLLAVHVPDLIQRVKAISEAGGGMVSIDTTLNKDTYKVARFAAGATKQAAQIVDEGIAQKSFAVIRPPGHHAESNSAGGFCFFNNIAIAAEWLITKRSYRRVAIVDIDHHFGNGTSHIFYHRNDVLYISLHAHPMYSYPGSGYPTEIGIAEGQGYNINIPLLPGTSSLDWLYALTFANNILEQYKPEIILVSVGFDALKGDPVGVLNLSTAAFQGAGFLINAIASKLCEGKICCTLEGGYKIEQLEEVAQRFVKGILGHKNSIIDNVNESRIADHTRSMLNQVYQAHKNYWVF